MSSGGPGKGSKFSFTMQMTWLPKTRQNLEQISSLFNLTITNGNEGPENRGKSVSISDWDPKMAQINLSET